MSTISLQSPLDQPKGKDRLLESLKSELTSDDYVSCKIIVAFAKSGAFYRLEQEIDAWKSKDKKIEAIIGVDEHGTSSEALSFAMEKLNSVGIVHGKSSFNSTFHPKIFLFEGSGTAKVFVGSNNMTVGGIETNSESYIAIDMKLPEDRELLQQCQAMWSDSLKIAKSLDQDLLAQLQISGLVLSEKEIRKVRVKTDVALAESEKDYDARPNFPKVSAVPATRMTASPSTRTRVARVVSTGWKSYGDYLSENSASNVNLYWNVGKKNNHLNIHLWALDFLVKNGPSFDSGEERSLALRDAVNERFPEKTMEGVRALLFSKLIGLIKDYRPETSAAYKTLRYPTNNDADAKHNQAIITQQIEKFYFWNDIFRSANRHLGPGGRTQTANLFHIYPVFFIYQLILLLNAKGYTDNNLSRFEINAFVILARTHNDLEEVAKRIIAFRESESPDQIEEFLKDRSKEMDSRFYAILQYLRYFNFDTDLIVLKPEFLEELGQRVKAFNDLGKAGNLIEFDDSDSDSYRNLLFSSKDIISYHQGL